jgi:O-antigen biosynthesis protein WbqP
MKRLFDITLAVSLILLSFFVFIFLWIIIKFTTKGSVIYWSDRVGRDNIIFKMPKFRSMHCQTPSLATDLLKNPSEYLTPIGSFLRKSSLDELPQLWSILKGDMSFVGPRPALFNQYDLIKLRTAVGVDKILPGLTGLAQVKGRDELSILQKVDFDKEYMQSQSLWLDIKIILLTLLNIINCKNVSH